jgi:hypothetical protein
MTQGVWVCWSLFVVILLGVTFLGQFSLGHLSENDLWPKGFGDWWLGVKKKTLNFLWKNSQIQLLPFFGKCERIFGTRFDNFFLNCRFSPPPQKKNYTPPRHREFSLWNYTENSYQILLEVCLQNSVTKVPLKNYTPRVSIPQTNLYQNLKRNWDVWGISFFFGGGGVTFVTKFLSKFYLNFVCKIQ